MRTTKKILFITPFSLRSNHAGVVYTRQLLEELSKQCDIDIVYFRYKRDKEFQPCKNMHIVENVVIDKKYKLLGILSLFWIFPQFSARFSLKICRKIQRLIDNHQYDFVYFDFSQSFAYSLFLKHPHKILMAHDVMAQKYARMKTYLRPWAMFSEKRILRGGEIFTFSDKDCELIKDLYGLESQPTTFFLSEDVQKAVPSEGDYFVFFGGWSREENYEALEWFVDKVNPLIPHVKYKIIGGGLPDSLKKKIGTLPNFEYLGFVDNPYPIIAKAKAEIAPLRKGAGVKVKCIDALGCGTPIIGTKVAFEGIPEEFDSFMITVDSAEEYASVISKWGMKLADRNRFKSNFIEKYNNKTILNYINGSD